jgi:uncharacterized membrane protein
LKAATRHTGEASFEKAVSLILRAGVMVSVALEILGIVFFYHSYGDLNISEKKEVFLYGKDFFRFVVGLFYGGHGHRPGILLMTLGVTTLILTPYVRVIMSVLYFVREKNVKYALITLFVLVLLTMSLVH